MASPFDFVDSFSERTGSQATLKGWTGTTGFTPHFDTGGRFGNQRFVLDGLNGIETNYGGSTTPGSSGFTGKVGFGAAVKLISAQGHFGGSSIFATFPVGSNGVAFELHFTSDARLAIVRGGAGIIPGTISPVTFPLFLNNYYFIEWEVTFHESSDPAIEHQIDTRIAIEGQLVLDVSAILLGLPTASGNLLIRPGSFRFATGQESGFEMSFSDFYFRTGGIFVCAAKVLPCRPTADGAYKEWDIPASGTHFDDVDDILLATGDFIESTSAPVRDTFDLEDIDISITPDTRPLRMGQYSCYVEGSEGDDVVVHHMLVSGGDQVETDFAISGRYHLLVFDDFPFGGGDFLISAFNAIEAGVKAST